MRGRSRILLILLHLSAIAILLLYLKVVIYEWPPVQPFSGDQWYNPYAGVLGNKPLRANFHAHTKSWFGITYGENTEAEMAKAYSARGYDIIGISNYHSISTFLDTSPLYIPVYEHGLNLLKVHNLPIGADEVLLPSFPVHFSIHQTQQMLEQTATVSRLNTLCHPTMSHIKPRQLAKLSGYALLEVGNTLGMSVDHWDAALSAGRLVWVLSNDDTHDLIKEPTFIKWNMIYAAQPTAASALEALSKGAHYGVESYFGDCENTRLTLVEINGDALKIALDDNVNRIDLYGQDGALLTSAPRTDHISYLLRDTDTYVRAEVHMDDCVYYLNPMVRTADGKPTLGYNIKPGENALATWLIRLLIAGIILFLGYRVTRITRLSITT